MILPLILLACATSCTEPLLVAHNCLALARWHQKTAPGVGYLVPKECVGAERIDEIRRRAKWCVAERIVSHRWSDIRASELIAEELLRAIEKDMGANGRD